MILIGQIYICPIFMFIILNIYQKSGNFVYLYSFNKPKVEVNIMNMKNLEIIYRTPREFERFINSKKMKEVGNFPHYSFKDKVTSQQPMYSQYANTCTILNVNDTLVHLAPEQRGRNLLDELANLVKKEQAEKGYASGFMIGGQRNDEASYALSCDIATELDRHGVDFSMICGKINTPKHALDSLCKDGDRFIFTQEHNPELEKLVKEEKNPTSDRLQAIFQKFFDIIDISPNHILKK